MQNSSMKNTYLEQIVQERDQLEEDLQARKRRSISQEAPAAAMRAAFGRSALPDGGSGGADVRITGFWRWRNVIVPPNAYVVHTRRGHDVPLHVGLGVSFRFDPVTDAFLVVPAAMQTIIIHANCVCRERQGVVVQGYVQWIIDDFATAYRNLDFSDEEDPMRVVNVQLREQAEAAIKDKVATMSIDDVLADKQPIIEELTARLQSVAEGAGQHDRGLGLRIVTVQIKEAVVCSPSVWEMLQRPFRSERSREARLAELENEALVKARESEEAQAEARLKIEAKERIQRMEAEAEARAFEHAQTERARRAKLEAEATAAAMEHERLQLEQQHELDRLRLENRLTLAAMEADADRQREETEIALAAARRKIENDRSEEAVKMALIRSLPAVAREMPKPGELRTIQIGDGALGNLAGSLAGLVDRLADGRGGGSSSAG